jgi:hypothetical protein
MSAKQELTKSIGEIGEPLWIIDWSTGQAPTCLVGSLSLQNLNAVGRTLEELLHVMKLHDIQPPAMSWNFGGKHLTTFVGDFGRLAWLSNKPFTDEFQRALELEALSLERQDKSQPGI